jgi:hypothetical protein
MKIKIPVNFSDVKPGERFTVEYIPLGKEVAVANILGEPMVHGVKTKITKERDRRTGRMHVFHALACRKFDWMPIGKIFLNLPELGIFDHVFVIRNFRRRNHKVVPFPVKPRENPGREKMLAITRSWGCAASA